MPISVRRMHWNGSMPSRRTSRRCATRVLTSARVSRKSSCWVACHCVPARRSNGMDGRWLRKIVLKRPRLYAGKIVPAGLFPDLLMLGKADQAFVLPFQMDGDSMLVRNARAFAMLLMQDPALPALLPH